MLANFRGVKVPKAQRWRLRNALGLKYSQPVMHGLLVTGVTVITFNVIRDL